MSQVITISPGGVISGLERKPGEGWDFKTIGGDITIERSSDIRWCKHNQKWYIEFLQGFRRGTFLTENTLPKNINCSQQYTVDPQNNLLLFTSYALAVEMEIAVLDWDRLNGMGITQLG